MKTPINMYEIITPDGTLTFQDKKGVVAGYDSSYFTSKYHRVDLSKSDCITYDKWVRDKSGELVKVLSFKGNTLEKSGE